MAINLLNLDRNSSFVTPRNFDQVLTTGYIEVITSTTSQSITFPANTAGQRPTIRITNGSTTDSAYISWGVGTASVPSIAAGTFYNKVKWLGPGMSFTDDFSYENGIVDTIAYVNDSGSVTLHMEIGCGQ